MRIGDIVLDTDVVLAPLAGYTDLGFRSICREAGAGLTYTEMVSVKGLLYGNDNTYNLTVTDSIETPSAVQVFGSDPEIFERIIPTVKADIIDINMGCPVPKIVKNGEGSALMLRPELAYEIVRATVGASDGRPVTVNFRAGFDTVTAVDFARVVERAGASAVTVHGRLRTDYYSGVADWDVIREVKEALDIPVIGNGDVRSAEDYYKAKDTGVDGVMIGRGALGNPYLFAEITGKPFSYTKPTLIRRHIESLGAHFNERYVVNNMKKHILAYLVGERGTKEAKRLICLTESLEEMDGILYERYGEHII